MLVALCSDKGSPGVTSAALALAAAWPEPTVLVEADLAGGDLGLRLRVDGDALPEAPTVLSLAAAARAGDEPEVASRHAHRLNGSVAVVPGALRGEQMARVGDWSRTADALARAEVPVIADLGQVHAGSAVLPIAGRADVVIVVCRPDMASVVRARERLAQLGPDLGALRGRPPRLFGLLVSTPRLGPAHASDLAALLAESAASPFLAGTGFIAHDPASLRRLERGADPSGRLARTPLMRTARDVVSELRNSAHSAAVTSRSAAASSSALGAPFAPRGGQPR